MRDSDSFGVGPVSTRRRLAATVVTALAVVLAVAPIPSAVVENLYSRRLYLIVQPWVSGASNVVPFALLDIGLVAAATGWIAWAVRAVRRRPAAHRWRAARDIATGTVVASAALYLAFLAMWGLNYRRVPLAEKLRGDAGRVSVDAARRLAADAVERVNALYAASRGGDSHDDAPDALLAAGFARAQIDLGASRLARPGRPKQTLLDAYFRGAGVEGMTDPYFLETLVASGLLDIERPFVVAHEWAHLAGYADESEANFVGWLTCLHGSARDQYSGWLYLYGEVASGLPRGDRPGAGLAPGPRADLRAIAARLAREIQPRLSAAGWRVYDQYLKANRVEAGTASYAYVVRLILATRFDRDWRPELERTP
jgi:hypothetical protein